MRILAVRILHLFCLFTFNTSTVMKYIAGK